MSVYTNIALQLWSVHEDAERDLPGTLRRLKDAGINGFEHFKVTDYTRDEFAALMKEYDMQTPSIHLGYELLTEHWREYCEYLLPLGLKRLVMPGYHVHNEEEYAWFTDGFCKLGENVRAAGADLLYHNHIVEFTDCVKDGKPYWVRMAEDFPDIGFQVDCYWATRGGYNVLDLLERYPEQIRSLHIKNGKGGQESCKIGEGIIDFKPILARAEELGIDWTVLEYESDPSTAYDFCENAVKYIHGLK